MDRCLLLELSCTARPVEPTERRQTELDHLTREGRGVLGSGDGQFTVSSGDSRANTQVVCSHHRRGEGVEDGHRRRSRLTRQLSIAATVSANSRHTLSPSGMGVVFASFRLRA